MKKIVFLVLFCFFGGYLFSQSPYPPGLIYPVDTVIVCTLTPLMEWSDVSGASSYEIQVSVSANMNTIVANVEGLPNSHYQILPGTLNYGTLYYWRVDVTTPAGKSNWSEIKVFITGESITPAPSISYPPNGAINVPLSPSFFWETNPTANKYRLQISTTPVFGNMVFDSIYTSGAIFHSGILSNNTTYYWRVAGINNCGQQGLWSNVWTFITVDQVPQPPALMTPQNSSCSNSPVYLEWNNNQNIVSYRIQIASDSLFQIIIYDSSGILQSNKTFNLGAGEYFWRVKATNAIGTGSWSTVWNFKVYLTISGNIRYCDDINKPVTGGMVKAFKLDKSSGKIMIIDSAQLNSDGSYLLNKIPQDSVDIGVFPNSTPPSDWVITYYPSTIYWQEAVVLYPTSNISDVNIDAVRMQGAIAGNSISGKISGLIGTLNVNLKDVVIYAKYENIFVKCTISDDDGIYHLQSLPVGNLKLIVDRFGFTGDSINVNISSTSNIDSVNFHLNRLHVGVKQVNNTIPSDFKLFQNYPNPFNPSTNIKFQIANDGFVILRVYDLLGREIATLVNEKMKAGVYEIPFSINKFTDFQISSGLYFYKLQVEGLNGSKESYIETKKMLYIK